MAFDPSEMMRARKTASSWVRRVGSLLRDARTRNESSGTLTWLIGYEAGEFVRSLLWEADMLVALVNDDQIEELEEAAKDFASALRKKRLSAKLANVEGRTEAEATLFREASERMRA